MTGKLKEEQDALIRLADILVEDIFETSDEDILDEVIKDGRDPKADANVMRTLLERLAAKQGKATLIAAKAAVSGAATRAVMVKNFDRDKARHQYDRMLSRDSDLTEKMTLAARNGVAASERDIESLLEDLAELNALDDEDGEG